MRHIKAEARLVHRVSGKTRHIFGRGKRQGLHFPIDSVRIDETRALHLQLFGERVHLSDECVRWRQFRTRLNRFQPGADVIGQRVGGDIVGLHERGIKQIAQRDGVTGLKADVIFRRSSKGLRRNGHTCIEIAGFFL